MVAKRHALARARRAAGFTQEQLAEALGVDYSTVGRWESGTNEPRSYIQPRLARALGVSAAGLAQLLAESAAPISGRTGSGTRLASEVTTVTASRLDYDAWSDDLDRTLVCLGRQEFDLAKILLDRWIPRFDATLSDSRGLYLYGRSLRLLGDVRQDQGMIRGPLSARQSYLRAINVFRELGASRRVAQSELQLAVVDEMSGALESAARQYQQLAADERLSERDRTRAQLWIGTALSKRGLNKEAVSFIRPAIARFERLEEPQDWSLSYQKLALACRGGGNLRGALGALDVALSNRPGDAPIQRVRLDTAHAHVLLSDTATASSGLALLDGAAETATRYGMMHQLQSITGIRRAYERQA